MIEHIVLKHEERSGNLTYTDGVGVRDYHQVYEVKCDRDEDIELRDTEEDIINEFLDKMNMGEELAKPNVYGRICLFNIPINNIRSVCNDDAGLVWLISVTYRDDRPLYKYSDPNLNEDGQVPVFKVRWSQEALETPVDKEFLDDDEIEDGFTPRSLINSAADYFDPPVLRRCHRDRCSLQIAYRDEDFFSKFDSVAGLYEKYRDKVNSESIFGHEKWFGLIDNIDVHVMDTNNGETWYDVTFEMLWRNQDETNKIVGGTPDNKGTGWRIKLLDHGFHYLKKSERCKLGGVEQDLYRKVPCKVGTGVPSTVPQLLDGVGGQIHHEDVYVIDDDGFPQPVKITSAADVKPRIVETTDGVVPVYLPSEDDEVATTFKIYRTANFLDLIT